MSGIGEEAFWVYSGHDGTIYSLEGNYLVRVGVGGKGDAQTMLRNASSLARFALRNLARQ